MMQLLCSGVRLDLYDNADIQFTHKNPLFAFDDLQCERTTQFKLPCTPTNDRVLELARIPAYAGNGMRSKFDAQLQAGTVVKDGYLYISDYDGHDYTAVLVTGELIDLQRVKDAGKLTDILSYRTGVIWSDAQVKDANGNNLLKFDLVRHQTAAEHQRPSCNLMQILSDAATKLGITIDTTNLAPLLRYRIIAGADLSIKDMNAVLENDPNDSPIEYTQIEGLLLNTGYADVQNQIIHTRAISDGGNIIWDFSNATNYNITTCGLPYFEHPVTIEFPSDFPADYCLFKVTNHHLTPAPRNGYYGYEFFGTRGFAFNPQGGYTYFGASLAGQKVQIPANVCFFLGKASGLVNPTPTTVGELGEHTYALSTVGEYTFNVKLTMDDKFEYGQTVAAQAILPDCTMIELLKACAYMTGTVLNYEDGVVLFETLQTLPTPVKVDRLTKRGEVKRVFSNYARENMVQFNHDGVYLSEEITNAYTVDNDTLEESKDLATMPFSEGGLTEDGLLYVRGEKATIGDANLSNINMLRVGLPLNNRIEQLCAESTQIKIECRMSMLEDGNIKTKTVLLVDNLQYMVAERVWQKNTAQFTLAKLP